MRPVVGALLLTLGGAAELGCTPKHEPPMAHPGDPPMAQPMDDPAEPPMAPPIDPAEPPMAPPMDDAGDEGDESTSSPPPMVAPMPIPPMPNPGG